MTSLKEAYQALDPARPLDGPHADAWYVPRRQDAIGELIEHLSLSDTVQRAVIVGQRGTGKSTELARIRRLHPGHLGVVNLSPSSDRANFDAAMKEAQLRFGTPLILADGFERLPLPEAASSLSDLVNRHVPFVATAPMELVFQHHETRLWDAIDHRIVLPVVDTEDSSILRRVIERRVSSTVFGRGAISRLVHASGGLFRDLLRLAQGACARASLAGRDKVAANDVDEVVRQRRFDLAFTLSLADLDYLDQVDLGGRLVQDPRAWPLIAHGAILACNDEVNNTTFRIHPLVEELVEEHRGRRTA